MNLMQTRDAWEGVAEPRCLICLDTGLEIGWNFQHVQQTVRDGETLRIHGPTGVIEIVGPAARELHREFCRAKSTLIKTDGLDLLSVRLLTREPKPER